MTFLIWQIICQMCLICPTPQIMDHILTFVAYRLSRFPILYKQCTYPIGRIHFSSILHDPIWSPQTPPLWQPSPPWLSHDSHDLCIGQDLGWVGPVIKIDKQIHINSGNTNLGALFCDPKPLRGFIFIPRKMANVSLGIRKLDSQ